MVARVASFEGINVEAAESTLGRAEAVISPLVENLAGYRGHLQLIAADGKVLLVTFFDSGDDARAAESVFDQEMPRQLGDLFQSWSGRRVGVDVYNVLSDERR